MEGQSWQADATGKAAIWSCGGLPFQEISKSEPGYVRVKEDGIHTYSCYAPPGMRIEDFETYLDCLVGDVNGRSPVAIAGDFNTWAIEWGSTGTNIRGQVLL